MSVSFVLFLRILGWLQAAQNVEQRRVWGLARYSRSETLEPGGSHAGAQAGGASCFTRFNRIEEATAQLTRYILHF